MHCTILPNSTACSTTHVIHRHTSVFSCAEHSSLIINALKHMRTANGIAIHGYVVMPDHLHLLTDVPSSEQLQGALSAFRRFTAKQLLEKLIDHKVTWAIEQLQTAPDDATFWRAGYHPVDASQADT